ncbi:carcinoembryonic antigen-related cell adhesion molecule 5-like, partial [Anoplopoma fimbria]|uniref:carcinoembryonic antigen-related cell adhesion molecule 5-like n=1 Tax=Anoplopoma fimbria TaxID=229290 RepID=UPI0023EE27CA
MSPPGLTEAAGVLPDTLIAAVGDKVMFTTTLPPTVTPFTIVEWKFGDKNIISFNVDNITGPEYEGRVTLFMSTGSLELRDLTPEDSGEYIVTIFPAGEPSKTGNTRLDVQVPVSDVMVTASSTDLVEFNSSVRLSCSSSGSSLSFLWLNGSSEVTASDRVQLTDGGANLTIINVTRYDQGPYTCQVSNLVSTGTSAPINLFINYGPENIILTVSPSKEIYAEGSDITLSCSVDSKPAAQFMWLLNGDLLSDTGPELRLMDIKESQSGNYSCQAFNSKTLRYEMSQPAAISVLARVANANVVVTSNTTDMLEYSTVRLSCSSSGSFLSFLWLNSSSEVKESDRVKLSDGGSTLTIVSVTRYDQGPFRCQVFNPVSNDTSGPVNLSINLRVANVVVTSNTTDMLEYSTVRLSCSSSGSSPSFLWLNSSSEVTASDRVQLTDGGANLTIINVTRYDQGPFKCQVSNPVSTGTSAPINLFINYGPENIILTISPSKENYAEGSDITLSCSAVSRPAALFQWFLNGDLLSDTGPELRLMNIQMSQREQPPSTCSAGCIAGIVIAVLVLLFVTAGGVYHIYNMKKKKEKLSNINTATGTGAEGQDNKAYAGRQELNYADITIFQKRDGGTVQLGVQGSTSDYSQIRVNNNPSAASSPPTYDAHLQRQKKPAPQPDSDGAQVYAKVRKN